MLGRRLSKAAAVAVTGVVIMNVVMNARVAVLMILLRKAQREYPESVIATSIKQAILDTIKETEYGAVGS